MLEPWWRAAWMWLLDRAEDAVEARQEKKRAALPRVIAPAQEALRARIAIATAIASMGRAGTTKLANACAMTQPATIAYDGFGADNHLLVECAQGTVLAIAEGNYKWPPTQIASALVVAALESAARAGTPLADAIADVTAEMDALSNVRARPDDGWPSFATHHDGFPTFGGSSTVTTLAVSGTRAQILHFGGGRAYRLRAGVLTRITNEHTLAALDSPELPADADDIIVRKDLERHELEVASGDIIVLAGHSSRKLFADEAAILRVLGEAPEDACRTLIETTPGLSHYGAVIGILRVT